MELFLILNNQKIFDSTVPNFKLLLQKIVFQFQKGQNRENKDLEAIQSEK